MSTCVLVPLDGSALAEAILPFVSEFAGPLGLEIVLLRVVLPVSPQAMDGSPLLTVDDVEARLAEAVAYLAPIATRLTTRGIRARTDVRQGRPVDEIVAGAKEAGADFIAMTTHGRGGLSRLLFGSVAEAVLRESEAPVFLMRLTARQEAELVVPALRRGAATETVHPEALSPEVAMRVGDLMTREVITVSPDTSVQDAQALMLKANIRHLVVTEGGSLAGIVTDRDIRLNLPSPATSLSAWEVNYLVSRLTVERAMTRTVLTVTPDTETAEAATLMLGHRIGALPVLEGTRIVGIVTETDLLRTLVRPAASPGPPTPTSPPPT
jgi:CBS domain-containing protein/nucleotide-binding universal stress UspA family protein